MLTAHDLNSRLASVISTDHILGPDAQTFDLWSPSWLTMINSAPQASLAHDQHLEG